MKRKNNFQVFFFTAEIMIYYLLISNMSLHLNANWMRKLEKEMKSCKKNWKMKNTHLLMEEEKKSATERARSNEEPWIKIGEVKKIVYGISVKVNKSVGIFLFFSMDWIRLRFCYASITCTFNISIDLLSLIFSWNVYCWFEFYFFALVEDNLVHLETGAVKSVLMFKTKFKDIKSVAIAAGIFFLFPVFWRYFSCVYLRISSWIWCTSLFRLPRTFLESSCVFSFSVSFWCKCVCTKLHWTHLR